MPVRVCELKVKLEDGIVETAWCGRDKPFGVRFTHLLEVRGLHPSSRFLYGGGDNPERGVIVGPDDRPNTLALEPGETIHTLAFNKTASGSSEAAPSLGARRSFCGRQLHQQHQQQQQPQQCRRRAQPRRGRTRVLLCPGCMHVNTGMDDISK